MEMDFCSSNWEKGDGSPSEGFTRDGAFTVDSQGKMVTATGYYVLTTKNEAVFIPEEAKMQKEQNESCIL